MSHGTGYLWPYQPPCSRSRDRGRLALAGVSGEGFSAVNAHVVIEEADPAWNAATSPGIRPHLFVMSARTSKALRDLTHRYLAYLEPSGQGAACHLRDICHSAIHRRQHHAYRFAAVVQDHNALISALYNFLEEESTSEIDVDPNITENGLREALVTLATRYVVGKEVTDWGPASEEDARFVSLPTYAWQTASYWREA